MGPIKAVESVIFKSFRFSGRASRSEFWWWSLVQGLVYCAAVAADISTMMQFGYAEGYIAPDSVGFWSFWTPILSLLTFFPTLAVTIRRLHDSNKSGFFYFFLFIPMIGWILYLVFMCLPSTPDENNYGPSPHGGMGGGHGGGLAESGLPKVGGGARKAKHNPYAGYALLERKDETLSTEDQEQRKAAVQEYYRSRVLGQPQTS
ncbi:DUF805 domain-containing protein [Mesobacterium pallidum]|uniref:DUF805 domain-containing protein n=1 Tax=Mesobacterium pallidum TaxID=2872037 RepID=UPI001EE378FA|nr:DUF805 domain-containing protein [Mesobacterium pallidum]